MRYFDVEQSSEEWFLLRRGVPTASNFDRVLTPAKAQLSKQADSYIAELIGETMSLIPPDGIENATTRAMQWGQRCEAEARSWYSMHRDCDVANGGFCMSECGRFGCSPDFIVGLELAEEMDYDSDKGHYAVARLAGAGELKCPQSQTQVEYLLDGQLPTAYRWQVHGHLWVTGAPWCDFMSYHPGLEPLLLRIERNEDTEMLGKALEAFWERYQLTLRRVRAMK